MEVLPVNALGFCGFPQQWKEDYYSVESSRWLSFFGG
jgi:hypothetical protein